MLPNQFNWINLLTLALVLFVLYLALTFTKSLLSKINILGKIQPRIVNFLHHFLLLYELIAILLLGSVFVLINPILHGLILAVLLLGGYKIIKDYVSGRILQFDSSITIGNSLKTKNTQGIISETGRLGLKLRNNKGLQFVNYSNLLADGYLLLSGEEIGGFYHLKISPKESEEKKNHKLQLMDKLVTTPYLDWNHKPELQLIDDNPNMLQAKVLVKEERHLPDLLELIKDWGYNCKISKK